MTYEQRNALCTASHFIMGLVTYKVTFWPREKLSFVLSNKIFSPFQTYISTRFSMQARLLLRPSWVSLDDPSTRDYKNIFSSQ
jgi:hypothetical protein